MNLAEILLVSIVILLVILIVIVVAVNTKAGNGQTFGAGLKAIRKSNVDSKLAGVCAGLGEHSPIPAWIWRVFFLLLVFAGGVGLIAYIIFAVCMPSAPNENV